MDSNYIIDYDLFTTLEIIKIIEFFKIIEQTKTKSFKPEYLKTKYREYQNIINNKSLEKKYDKMLYNKSKVSIYQVMKPIIQNNSF